VGTVIEKEKEKRVFEDRTHLLELALKADYAFIRAYKADLMGNLVAFPCTSVSRSSMPSRLLTNASAG
jgi:acyl CoA:acetate/3-ketoacid CoA transferase alpha subunit